MKKMKNTNSKKLAVASFIFLTFGATFSACSSSSSSNEHSHHEATSNEEEIHKETISVETAYASVNTETVDQLLTGYLKIKDALIATDAETTKNSAKAMVAEIDSENSIFNHIVDIANKISDSDGVEDQRVKFESLSKEIYEVVKASKASTTLYKQYCPMAFDNKGAFWLSTSEEVLNPYFGDKMLRCGSVQETISVE